jgi:chemotaxis protein methyltransferase CheR
MAAAGCADRPERYLKLLAESVRAFDELVDALTVGETYFFRDAWHFDLVVSELLPHARARAERGGPGLRAWSAGCASGEEIYSLAITLAEENALEHADLLATDISAAALEKARKGRYRPWSLRGLALERSERWLTPRDTLFELSERIKVSARFEVLNLAEDGYPAHARGIGELDLILCRNVLIYLDDPTVSAVGRRLAASLRPGGLLLAGPSDPSLVGLVDLEVLTTPQGIAYRRPSPASLAAAGVPPRPTPRMPTPPRGPRRIAADLELDVDATLARLRRLAALDPSHALAETTRLAREAPERVDLALLRATLLISLDEPVEAEAVLAEILARDSGVALAHFMRASLRTRRGDVGGARESLTRAMEEARRLPADAPLPYGDGAPAGHLVEAAERRLAHGSDP